MGRGWGTCGLYLQDPIQTIEIQPEQIKFQRYTAIGEDGIDGSSRGGIDGIEVHPREGYIAGNPTWERNR